MQGIDKGTTNDILAMEIRLALQHLGEITYEIATYDLLDNIVLKFCLLADGEYWQVITTTN